jgi:hypothetical protein
MDDDNWETFILDCVLQLKAENQYAEVHRLGGAGDKGRDVCGYTQSAPLAGTWDLYQAKHYTTTLSPSDFAAELAKFLVNVQSNSYTLPRCYYICALKVGASLFDLVKNPEQMRMWILGQWKTKSGKFESNSYPLTSELTAFIENFPFDIFQIRTPADLLAIHRRNPREYWKQFGVLAERKPNPTVQEEPSEEEQTYIAALLDVYAEQTNCDATTLDQAPAKFEKHFVAQRRLFYCAEGLNRFSRDNLPGAFDTLLDQVDVGIGSTVAFPHKDGLARLGATLNIANALNVTNHILSARLEAGDLQGCCHHLANQSRVAWVDDDDHS